MEFHKSEESSQEEVGSGYFTLTSKFSLDEISGRISIIETIRPDIWHFNHLYYTTTIHFKNQFYFLNAWYYKAIIK